MEYDLKSIALIVAIVGGLFGILTKLLGGFRGLLDYSKKAWHLLTRYGPKVPRYTIRAIPKNRQNWWHMGSSDGRPSMQVVSHWSITNVDSKPVLILGAFLRRPWTEGSVSVEHPKGGVFGRYPILPGDTSDAVADFWIRPPFRREGQDFKTTVILIDQYGNRHKAKGVAFSGPKPKKPKKPDNSEQISRLRDPIQKQVASVLKAEVHRYAACGRLVGGLGSVQTRQAGKLMAGVGADWRDANSPENQSIVIEPGPDPIVSDNATALMNFYSSLENTEEQERFVGALLKRLSRKTEYASVGYLILLVLFRINRLPEALKTAKQHLQDDSAYGFSDCLRLLDGLLRFEHRSFSLDSLDQVEAFIRGIEEPVFAIPERIAAIRALRLLNLKSPSDNETGSMRGQSTVEVKEKEEA